MDTPSKHWLDITVIVTYLSAMIGMGLYFMRRQKSTTTYTTIGGVRAVIWTDVVQAIIMFAGIVMAIILLVIQIPGGVAGIWTTAQDSDLVYFSARIPGWEETQSFGKRCVFISIIPSPSRPS